MSVRPLAARLASFYHIAHIVSCLVALTPNAKAAVLAGLKTHCGENTEGIGKGAEKEVVRPDGVAGAIAAAAALFPVTTAEGNSQYLAAVSALLIAAAGAATSQQQQQQKKQSAEESALQWLPRAHRRAALTAAVFGALLRRDAADALSGGTAPSEDTKEEVFNGLCALEGTFSDGAFARLQQTIDATTTYEDVKSLFLVAAGPLP